jgi:hypothetical protein
MFLRSVGTLPSYFTIPQYGSSPPLESQISGLNCFIIKRNGQGACFRNTVPCVPIVSMQCEVEECLILVRVMNGSLRTQMFCVS